MSIHTRTAAPFLLLALLSGCAAAPESPAYGDLLQQVDNSAAAAP